MYAAGCAPAWKPDPGVRYLFDGPENEGVADFNIESDIPPLLNGSSLGGRYFLSSLSHEVRPIRKNMRS